jgi:hypothetical protein
MVPIDLSKVFNIPEYGERGKVKNKYNSEQRKWRKWENAFNGRGEKRGMKYNSASRELAALRGRAKRRKQNEG